MIIFGLAVLCFETASLGLEQVLIRGALHTFKKREANNLRYYIFTQKKINFPQWTQYHEECLQVVESSREYPTDQMLVHLVRIQLVKNKISKINWIEISSPGSIGTQLRQEFYMKTFVAQIKELELALPEDLKSNCKQAYPNLDMN